MLGIIFWIGFLLVMGLIFFGVCAGADEYAWFKTTATRVSKCELVSGQHKSSTLRTHAVPVATGKGVGMGMVTTGEDEKFITVWFHKDFGNMVVDDKAIFQWAKNPSDLWIKFRGGDYRIVGIEK